MSAIAPSALDASAVYTVAVRDLCEFTAKVGSLDLRFTPAPTALQGMLGHQIVAQRRGPDHESEVKLSGQFQELRVCLDTGALGGVRLGHWPTDAAQHRPGTVPESPL